AELSAEVRAALATSALRVRDGDGVLCEIWLRKEAPESPQREQSLGIAYGELASGALIGAVKFHRKAGDYRRQSNPPGVYTWRYALLPSDGNHMGVAPNRDFLMLAPASEDKSAKDMDLKALMELSRKASGTTHPSVWSLTAAAGEHASVPAIEHEEEENLWVLFVNLPVRAQSGAVKQVLLAIVLVGAAPEA
ncbi:MAG TPA: hypothetical protein VNL38_03585, partial [Candidatus Nitrosotenuis sp.]|nr:hypothetical protein [Candidatus Nitrosotenuis sp.]